MLRILRVATTAMLDVYEYVFAVASLHHIIVSYVSMSDAVAVQSVQSLKQFLPV